MSELGTAVTVDVRPYVDADEPEVLDLLMSSMGEGPAGGRTSEFFRWKHVHNPFGRSFMLVAEADGRIVGLRAFMRWGFAVGGEALNAVRAVDTATHPDYRRLGIFSRLTARALDDLVEEADLVFNTPNEKSLPGYLKLGWEVVGKVPFCIRPMRPVAFASRIRSRKSGGASDARPSLEATRAAVLLQHGLEVDWLLERAVHEDRRFRTLRSVSFLRWRYAETPFDYRAVVSEGEEGLNGFAIFRVRPRGRLWETTVSELVVDPFAGHEVRRQLLMAVAQASSVDHISVASPHGEAAVLARSGFLPSPASITLVAKPLRGHLPADVTAKKNWALSLGDIEVF
ncbi:MAG: GNAT family N-acetyltransferase [Actinomycetota bacterium]